MMNDEEEDRSRKLVSGYGKHRTNKECRGVYGQESKLQALLLLYVL